jgi:hypothetical protein
MRPRVGGISVGRTKRLLFGLLSLELGERRRMEQAMAYLKLAVSWGMQCTLGSVLASILVFGMLGSILGTIDRGDPISAAILLIVLVGYYWFPIGFASAALYIMIVYVLQPQSVGQRIVSTAAAAGIVGTSAFATGFIETERLSSPVALSVALPYAFAMAAAAFADTGFKKAIWDHMPRFGTPRQSTLDRRSDTPATDEHAD